MGMLVHIALAHILISLFVKLCGLLCCSRLLVTVILSVQFHCVVGDMFPASYNMSIINAQHGSWDRTPAIGYRVMVLNLNSDGLAQNYSALVEGWLLPNGTVWGKQATCAVLCCSTHTHTLTMLSATPPWSSRGVLSL